MSWENQTTTANNLESKKYSTQETRDRTLKQNNLKAKLETCMRIIHWFYEFQNINCQKKERIGDTIFIYSKYKQDCQDKNQCYRHNSSSTFNKWNMLITQFGRSMYTHKWYAHQDSINAKYLSSNSFFWTSNSIMDTAPLPIGHTPNWLHQMATQYPKISLLLLNPNTIRRDLYML